MSEDGTARDSEIARLERELRRWKAVVATSLFVGIVASVVYAVAVPNLCRRALDREEDHEAWRNLSGLFMAEKAFNGEYGTYGTDLVSIHWRPEGDVAWAYGFCNQHPAPNLSGISDWTPARSTTADTGMRALGGYSPNPASVPVDPCGTLGVLGLAQTFRASGGFFTAFAVRYDSSGYVEVWAIDQDKHLKRIR